MFCFGNASVDRVTQAEQKNLEQLPIPDDIIYELVFFWNRFTCKIILILIERNLRSQEYYSLGLKELY